MFLQVGLDRSYDLVGRRFDGRLETGDDVALLVDDELGEVPLDVAGAVGLRILCG